MHHTTNDPSEEGATSVLAALRRLHPNRPLDLADALWLAELQANRLLQLRGAAHDVPVPTTIVTELPRITVEHDPDLPQDAASGCSTWDYQRRSWVISLNPTEPRRRRRFTVLHEYKHILDHGTPGIRITGSATSLQRPAAEVVADYFAGCVLMPKRLLTAAFYDGIQHPADLAELFDVSEPAIRVRLNQIGLGEPPVRLATTPAYRYQPGRPGLPNRQPYYRSAGTYLIEQPTKEAVAV
jgi:Zn-dependent peptidase ImmA (M78 family)